MKTDFHSLSFIIKELENAMHYPEVMSIRLDSSGPEVHMWPIAFKELVENVHEGNLKYLSPEEYNKGLESSTYARVEFTPESGIKFFCLVGTWDSREVFPDGIETWVRSFEAE